MKKALLIVIAVFTLMTALIVFNCCSSKTERDSENKSLVKTDTIWNTRIKDRFYDCKFGDDRVKIVAMLQHLGFHKAVDGEYISMYKDENCFEWEGMKFNLIVLRCVNYRFCEIEFQYRSQDKSDAISKYNKIVTAMSEKYRFNKSKEGNGELYGLKRAYGKNGVNCCVRLDQSDNTMTTAVLSYEDNTMRYRE